MGESEIGKLYEFDGAAHTQISAVYDHDGTANHLIYKAEITVTNLLPTDSISWSWTDWGYDATSSNGATITMDPAKRYFWRHRTWVNQWNVNGSADYYSWVQGGLAGISTPSAYHSLDKTLSGIVSGKASTYLAASMRRQYIRPSAYILRSDPWSVRSIRRPFFHPALQISLLWSCRWRFQYFRLPRFRSKRPPAR